jgi:hypothetical protein
MLPVIKHFDGRYFLSLVIVRNSRHDHSLAWDGETDEQGSHVSPPVLGCGGWSDEEVRAHQVSEYFIQATVLSTSTSSQ